ncbi:hypothetical protein G5V58_09580 [Nocardioides anomalus]|uniref:Uncharacterized protein n=1 Tax=Nocardioides anomalus TaxID=2712223 RepID=A0A6G6WCU7_9ACTN|nr:hypothetical protein [Nocardioides anomalus]QIG42977.1 hypothetical protein G5V58_09580 [Nocardioides anomalus]
MTPNACHELAAAADRLAAAHPDPRTFLVELAREVAGIPRGTLTAWPALLLGGRNRLLGGGFRPELRDHTAGQARHFTGTARAVTVLGADRTRWLGVHARRDRPDSPDGRLSELAVVFADDLLAGRLAPADTGDWIRRHVCG